MPRSAMPLKPARPARTLASSRGSSEITITKVEVTEFAYELEDIGKDYNGFFPIWEPGAIAKRRGGTLRIYTSAGVIGETIAGSAGQVAPFAEYLIGKNPLMREFLFNDIKRALRHTNNATYGATDIALWDIAGKVAGLPVYQLLGGYRTKLPCYASTFHGEALKGGLNSPEAYADFAEQCLGLGYPAYKLHVWGEPPFKRDVATMHSVGKRVGDKMDLMLDGSCAYRTFHDALLVGRALDDNNFMWYEDPYSDGGISAAGHRKLREMLKTPLLMTEMVRGLEPKVDFIAAGGTDYVRADLGLDGGITGVMKIAHVAEGFGLDCEIHGCSPAARHCMAAMRNTNYYEMGLLHPRVGPMRPPVYLDGYRDELTAIDKVGCVDVPEKPGIGVDIDWRWIKKNSTGATVWE